MPNFEETAEATRQAGKKCNVLLMILKLTPPGTTPFFEREDRFLAEIFATRWTEPADIVGKSASGWPVPEWIPTKNRTLEVMLNPHDGEDICHEVVCELIQQVRSGSCHTITRSYVNATVYFELKRFLRKRIQMRLASDPSLPDGLPDLHASSDREFLDEVIDHPRLSDEDKELLSLIAAGYTQTEIAEMWGVSNSTISKKLHRIIDIL